VRLAEQFGLAEAADLDEVGVGEDDAAGFVGARHDELPSRSSITLPVVIPLSRIACQPEYPARRWPVANESLACYCQQFKYNKNIPALHRVSDLNFPAHLRHCRRTR
jgi:hypothetical protein